MAKQTKKTTQKSTAKQTAEKRSKQNKALEKSAKPIRREIGAAICLFLGIFTILSIFGVKSWFTTKLLAPFCKGLVGNAGFYILPASFFFSTFILLFHGGRPVRLRVTACFVMAGCIGAITHLFLDTVEIPWGISMVAALYRGGIAGTTGGLLCGFFSMLLELIFSKIGAVLIFVILLILSLLCALNMTIAGIAQAVKNRPKLEYDEPEEPQDNAAAVVNYVAQKHIDHVQKKRAADFDLPVDDPPAPVRKRGRKRDVPSPDEFILEKRAQAKRAASKAAASETAPAEAAQVKPTVEAPQVELAPAQPEEPPVDILASLPQEEPVEITEAAPVQSQSPQSEPAAAPAWQSGETAVSEEEVAAVNQRLQAQKKQERAEAALAKEEVIQQLERSGQEPAVQYHYPPVSLLTPGKAGVDGTQEMRENKARLDETLHNFNIDATIVNIIRGPSVTRYELELASGVKLAKLTNLSEDIALALGATGVRISAIPDRISIVGIEVPNKLVSTVSLREVIDSPQFAKAKSKLSFAVGKDIGGNCVVGDIARMPHMLIAGTTGSGKSVCMNSIIISLLYKATPEEVKLIMVDPKMVELGIYNGIPHLLIPVVTDPKKAAGALQWAVTEMMRRYRMMSDAGVRNLEEYNKLAATSDDYDKMPQIVAVIDELADLMLVAAKEVEESICRVAQMGRAAGIHLIVATQRPSSDVITGLMKANIPSRIAFAVASAVDSRIILDTLGAEKLIGRGDMLYAPLGQGRPRRIQSCFITDEEVQAVVGFIKDREEGAGYAQDVMDEIDKRAEQSGKGGHGASAASGALDDGPYQDELLPAAVEVILETGQASVSMLQRRLKLGYARAARIVDEMEDKGIVGPFEGSKPRQLLITKEQWQAMQNGQPLEAPPAVEEEID